MQTVKEVANTVVEGAKAVAEKVTGNPDENKQEKQEKSDKTNGVEQPSGKEAVQEAVAGLEDAKEKKRKHGEVLGSEPALEKLPDKAAEKEVEKACTKDGGLKELERLEKNVEKENEVKQDVIVQMSNDNKRAKQSDEAPKGQEGDQA